MKILVTGGKGMLGRTLLRRLTEHECVGVDVDDFDITNSAATDNAVAQIDPDVVIHCAAMTAVDDCETKQDQAFAVNALGSANVAAACGRRNKRIIAISTDYVFAGDADQPYNEFDTPAPKTVYGASKLEGERMVRELCSDHLIARVAWLYGPGGPSFVHTMLKFGSQEGDPMKVVDDQIGNPTSTDAVASHLKILLENPVCGTVHLTNEGETTWFGFTKEIFKLAGYTRQLLPCKTEEYPRPAPRPANSRLEKKILKLSNLPPMPDWKESLVEFFQHEKI